MRKSVTFNARMYYKLFIFTIISSLAINVFPKVSHASGLEWDQTRVKIELKPGETRAIAKFVVTNTGRRTVHIDRIKTSCGCTGSILDQREILPGSSATVVGVFDKGTRQGLNHNRLEVFLKGQSKPVETLHMLVQVPRLIDAQPSIVFWNSSSTKTERQVVINLDKRYVDTISDIEYDPELLTITKEETTSAKTDYILYIMPKSFDEPMRHPVLVKAKGDGDLVAEVKLQVFVQP